MSRTALPERLQATRILSPIVRGLLWIDSAAQSYRTDPFARILLESPSLTGPLADLHVITGAPTYESEGPKALNAIFFETPAGRYLRMRPLCVVGSEQLFLVEDMTEIITGEQELRERDTAYQALFENASHGIYRTSLEGRHIYANPAMVALMGCENHDAFLAYCRHGLRQLHVEPQRHDEFMSLLLRDGKVIDFVSECLKATGEKIWVSVTAWLVRGPDGAPTHMDGTFTDVTERMRQHAAMQKAAETDALTGLWNRTRLYAAIEHKASKKSGGMPFTVMLVDLDRFKDINDVFGHATGDAVLLEVSERLRDVLGAEAMIARLGGDEFAVVLDDHALPVPIEELGGRLLDFMRMPIIVGGIEHAMTASVGMARFPDNAVGRAELLRKADIALYHVKSHGRNALCAFTPDLELNRQRAHYLVQELRDACKRGELELYYQPIVEAGTGVTIGFEALMRWHHPKRGLIPPLEFIPLAEDAGYMPEFGSWAINEACAHIATLPAPLHVSVNVSAVQFNAMDFVTVVEKALADSGLAPERLELEVTEGVVIRNEERTLDILGRLKKIGVRVALDDFGTGYSSFAYLQKFRFDKVKIDRSFVRDLIANETNAALVRAVLSIGRDLGLAVVAEGIENAEQRDRLIEEGCPFFQGFLYGRPQPFTDVATALALARLPSVPQPPSMDERHSA